MTLGIMITTRMRNKKFLALGLYAAMVFLCPSLVFPDSNGNQVVSISKITGQLFFDKQNRFSENVIDNPEYSLLLNQAVGDNSSTQLLLTAELQSKPEKLPANLKAKLTVIENHKILSSQTYPLGRFSQVGKYYLTALVNPSGCYPLIITVSILGQPKSTTLTKRVPYACGE